MVIFHAGITILIMGGLFHLAYRSIYGPALLLASQLPLAIMAYLYADYALLLLVPAQAMMWAFVLWRWWNK